MGNNRITGMADGIASTDAATVNQIPSGALFLLKASNLSDVANATTARGNLTAAKSGANSDITSITGLTTPLTVAQGGIGAATLTANNVLLGNGTSAPQFVAPSTAGNLLTSNGTTWVSSVPAAYPLTSGTAVASTSGTSIDFTSIPSWVKRVTVMYSGISVSGTSNLMIQVGAGSVTTSGYTSSLSLAVNATLSTTTSTAGLLFASGGAGVLAYSGQMIISTLGSNKWVCSVNSNDDGGARTNFGAGSITLGGDLDRVRFTTVNGTDTFDAGTINILYE
jgi:hypothetical protein